MGPVREEDAARVAPHLVITSAACLYAIFSTFVSFWNFPY